MREHGLSNSAVSTKIVRQLDARKYPPDVIHYAPGGYRMAVATQLCRELGITSRYEAIGLVFGLVGATSGELACYLSFLSPHPLARDFLSDLLELAKCEERGFVFTYRGRPEGLENKWLGSGDEYRYIDNNGEYHNPEVDREDEETRQAILALIADKEDTQEHINWQEGYFDEWLARLDSALQPIEPNAITNELGHALVKMRLRSSLEIADILPGTDCMLEEIMRGWAVYQAKDIGLTMLMEGREITESSFLGFLGALGKTGEYPDDDEVEEYSKYYQQMDVGRLRLPATKDDIIEAVIASPKAIQRGSSKRHD